MLRRRCRAVMDEEYVQEHILTGGIVGPVGGASPTHSWPLTAISLGVVASYPTHLRRAPRSAPAWSALRMVARQLVAPTSHAARDRAAFPEMKAGRHPHYSGPAQASLKRSPHIGCSQLSEPE